MQTVHEKELVKVREKAKVIRSSTLKEFIKLILSLASPLITSLEVNDDYDRQESISLELASKITIDDLKTFLETKDGRYFFRDLMEKAMKVRNEDKAKAFARILANEVKQGSIDWSETVVRTIYELTDAELDIFKKVAEPHDFEVGRLHRSNWFVEPGELGFTRIGGKTTVAIADKTELEKKIAVETLASQGVLVNITPAVRREKYEIIIESSDYLKTYELTSLGEKMWQYFQEI